MLLRKKLAAFYSIRLRRASLRKLFANRKVKRYPKFNIPNFSKNEPEKFLSPNNAHSTMVLLWSQG